jgi:predicted dehydrogenase
MLGYDHGFANAASDLVEDIALDRRCAPDFRDGAQCVAVLEAVTKSVKSGAWAKVEQVE